MTRSLAFLRPVFLSLLLAAAAPALAKNPPLPPAPFAVEGAARITDGDTIRLGDVRVRLHGIDAPESDQTCGSAQGRVPCGAMATEALTALIAGRPVLCQAVDVDRYNRAVAVCSVDGLDLNAAMARAGWAIAFTRYSQDYADEAALARQEGVGLWGYDFLAPADWRKGARR